jgi:hypothetical protein
LVKNALGNPVSCEEARGRLTKLRRAYEPKAKGLSQLLALDLPPWLTPEAETDGQLRLPGVRVGRVQRDLVG